MIYNITDISLVDFLELSNNFFCPPICFKSWLCLSVLVLLAFNIISTPQTVLFKSPPKRSRIVYEVERYIHVYTLLVCVCVCLYLLQNRSIFASASPLQITCSLIHLKYLFISNNNKRRDLMDLLKNGWIDERLLVVGIDFRGRELPALPWCWAPWLAYRQHLAP